MADVALAHVNILEGVSFSLWQASAVADYPLYRMADRSVAREARFALDVNDPASDSGVYFDTGGAEPVDTLIIAPGHGLDGYTWVLQNKQLVGDSWVWAHTPVLQSGDGLIVVQFTETTKPWWWFDITDATDGPTIAVPEMWITKANVMERRPSRPSGKLDDVFNAKNEETSGGGDRFLEYGPARRRREYSFASIAAGQKDLLVAAYNAWGGSKPFWIRDHEDSWLFVKFTSELDLREILTGKWSARLDVLEVIG